VLLCGAQRAAQAIVVAGSGGDVNTALQISLFAWNHHGHRCHHHK
jgi:hypothetical protein